MEFELDGKRIDLKRLRELCPGSLENFFSAMETSALEEESSSPWLALMDKIFPCGMATFREGFMIPFEDLPKYLSSSDYQGLLGGIVRYRLERGF